MTTTSERWFQRVVWVGIIANVALAVPTLLWPSEMLAFSRLPDAVPAVWVRFSSLLLILLSSFYVPAAVDCRRHRVNAWLSTAGRLAGVLFFCRRRASTGCSRRLTSRSSCPRLCCCYEPDPGQGIDRRRRRGDYRTDTMRRPAGELGAVAADCEIVTGSPATVRVPVRDEEPPFAETR